MVDPLVANTMSIAFGLLFLLGAVHKLTALPLFTAILADYRILPRSLVVPAAWFVGLVEAAIGAGWLFASERTAVAIATMCLLGTYSAAIAINLLRGRTHISCGCGFGRSAGGDELLSGWLVARNLLLALAAAPGFVPVGSRSLGSGDYLVLIAAVLTAVLLFAAGNQLINNRAAIMSWRRRMTRDD